MYGYRSQEELYKGLEPALNVKLKLLKRNKITNITKENIWNFLRETKWKSSVNLTLADMVQDIIHVDDKVLVNYYISEN